MPKYHPDDAHSILMRQLPPGSAVPELGCRITGLEYDGDAVAIARTRCSAVSLPNIAHWQARLRLAYELIYIACPN